MEKLLKKAHSSIITQFNTIQVLDNLTPNICPNLQMALNKHHQVFETSRGVPSSCGENDHVIPLILGSQPLNVHPYEHPFE